MAKGLLPSLSLVSLDEQEAYPNVKESETRCAVPSNAERHFTARVRVTRDEGEDDMNFSSDAADVDEKAFHVVELGDRPDPPTNPAPNPATLWTRLQTGWSEIEDQLAEWFGLDQSKYQWAVDEFLECQMAGDHSASKGNVEGLQMQDIQEQTMQRDSKGLNFEG